MLLSEYDWQWNMYDTVKGREWLADQDIDQYRCMEAPKVVIELKNYGMQFFRTKDGKIYQQAFGGQAYRCAFIADRTRHALVRTLFGQGDAPVAKELASRDVSRSMTMKIGDSRGKALTEFLLEASSGITNAKVDQGEEQQGSVPSAKVPRVSMIILTQSSCTAVRGADPESHAEEEKDYDD
ncbi:hypothetical protein V6N13_148608 [Hibiscus sabdariffa]